MAQIESRKVSDELWAKVKPLISRLNRYRKLLGSFEKTAASYLALLSLSAALICWRQTISIYG